MASLRGIMGNIRNFFASATNVARAGAGGVRSKTWLTRVCALSLRDTFVIAFLSLAAFFSFFCRRFLSLAEFINRIPVDDSDSDDDDGQVVMQVFSDDEDERVPHSTRLRPTRCHAI